MSQFIAIINEDIHNLIKNKDSYSAKKLIELICPYYYGKIIKRITIEQNSERC